MEMCLRWKPCKPIVVKHNHLQMLLLNLSYSLPFESSAAAIAAVAAAQSPSAKPFTAAVTFATAVASGACILLLYTQHILSLVTHCFASILLCTML